MNEITLTEWIKNFFDGKYNYADRLTQIEAGWYDWFCADRFLASKTEKLGKKLMDIANSKKFDNDKVYVWFKNNCPMCGSLYDDFRIADIESGDVLYTIVPKSGHSADKGKAEVWGIDNGFKEPLVHGTWREVVKFFMA